MTNIEVLKRTCNAIANTFYPDAQTSELVLFNAGISPEESAQPRDVELFKLAVKMVLGYVESSRNENGISTAVREDAIEKSIEAWCDEYGIDAEELLEDSRTVIKDISNMW